MAVFWMKKSGMLPTRNLQKYLSCIFYLHIKDRIKGTENPTDGRASIESITDLGTGDVGIAAVVSEAKKQAIRYFLLKMNHLL
jgi:sugar phosphate isomerase/epimerase